LTSDIPSVFSLRSFLETTTRRSGHLLRASRFTLSSTAGDYRIQPTDRQLTDRSTSTCVTLRTSTA